MGGALLSIQVEVRFHPAMQHALDQDLVAAPAALGLSSALMQTGREFVEGSIGLRFTRGSGPRSRALAS